MKICFCPVCEGAELNVFMSRKNVPVHQNLVVSDQFVARDIVRGDLEMMVCETCGFIFNRAFDMSLLNYGEDYDNAQSCSVYFESYMDSLVRDMVENQGVRNCRIVEVGCGKGNFLRKLVSYPGANNTGYGFDPSYIGPSVELNGRLRFSSRYYDEACADIGADIVVCRHVIEHVAEPLQMLRSVRSALAGSSSARVFFETPCVEWILRNRVFWDFFYEHCSLFTKSSLEVAFRRAGFSVDCISHVFGGQYLWLEGRIAQIDKILPVDVEVISLASAYSECEQRMKSKWLKALRDLSLDGRVSLWGAGAKGATFANLIDPECSVIECVVDINPRKQGKFIPGSGHPIVPPCDLTPRGVSSSVLMNPNYRREVSVLLEGAGVDVVLVELVS